MSTNDSTPDPTAGERMPDALHLCSLDCPEPCPHVWYPAFLPAALRVLSYDSGVQREADGKVGWDYGPEQGAWLRALAEALTGRDKCAHPAEHVTSDGLRWPLICDACRLVNPGANKCPCGCPADMHIGEIGCPCGLPDEPPCLPRIARGDA